MLGGGRRRGGLLGGLKTRLMIAALIAAVSLLGYCFAPTAINPFTGEAQKVSMSPEQEIQLGIASAPELVNQFEGEDRSPQKQQRVDAIGRRLVSAVREVHSLSPGEDPYQWQFTVLADDEVVNAFALPGGNTFITAALFDQLTDDQIAGVMAHEISHVIHRHGATRMEKAKLWQGLAGAGAVAVGDQAGAQIAQQMAGMVLNGYSRDDELESDRFGFLYTTAAGFDPQGLVELLQVLEKSSSGPRPPEYMSTHPGTDKRIDRVKALIQETQEKGFDTVFREIMSEYASEHDDSSRGQMPRPDDP